MNVIKHIIRQEIINKKTKYRTAGTIEISIPFPLRKEDKIEHPFYHRNHEAVVLDSTITLEDKYFQSIYVYMAAIEVETDKEVDLQRDALKSHGWEVYGY